MSGNIDIESLKKYLLNIQKSTIFKLIRPREAKL